MKRREYGFNFKRTFVLRWPLWVYATTALAVVCLIAAVLLRVL